MGFIYIIHALTITKKIEVHSKYKPSLFYQNAFIQCPNDECNKK